MKLLIDVNGNVGFDDWFDKSEAPKIVEALAAQGINVSAEEVDYEFKDVPILKKKDIFDSIPMTPRNIYIILSNADKENDDILKILGIERESGFVITTLIRKLQGEYIKWERIDHTQKWKDDKERMMAFANYCASKENKPDRQIDHMINTMCKEGCLRLEENKFPECGDKFNRNCVVCQFGKKYIQTKEDVDRFNEQLTRKKGDGER